MAGLTFSAPLPIDAVLGDVQNALRSHGTAVLVAAPGAGKTTRMPLALLDEPWREGRKIVVLEPRRIAARAAAERLASTLGSRLGDDVGLKTRLSSKTSAHVAIEVVTEGVFTRMILDDPELSGVASVLFDEFHERSLDADLGLALALDARTALRSDLKILVMSATLEASRVAKLLGDAPVIASEGRTFPIETRYLGRRAQRIDDDVVDAVRRAIERDSGSILVFLPGQGEIVRVAERLGALNLPNTIDIAPLYGALDPATQDRAISPAKAGRCKIVLATSIAETSITIEGVRVVIDSGLARVPRFEPDVGVARLETVRVSRASADQRRGRAGRTEPGICYRLWDEPETQGLVPFADPEIRVADLSSLLLDCAEWGTNDPGSLCWLDPPSEGALAAARSGLQAIGGLDAEGHITSEGRRLRSLPLPPRLARMLLRAGERGAARDAAELAAVLVERGIGGNDLDISTRLENFRRDRSRRVEDMRALSRQWARAATTNTKDGSLPPAELLALAYPERIAKNRGKRGSFLLANGRAGLIDTAHPLAAAPYLIVAELQGRAAATRIMLAAATDEAEVSAFAADRIESKADLTFDRDSRSVKARNVRRLGAVELRSESRPVRPDEDASPVLAKGIADIGVGNLPWSKAQLQLRSRVGFLRANDDAWPDLSDAALSECVERWLLPYLSGKTRVSEIDGSTLEQALSSLLPWPMRQRLDAEAPTHFEAPTGNSHALDYEGAGAPALHIRVQELFGLKEHPAIARGRLPLTLYLLSPAHRPIQITRDLPGFWAGSWAAVKADMRGQYPKHVWPDDPANAAPTTRAKPRGK
ncbi:ATP-dependent helicase HrpB [Hyphomicrobium denitrificans 1NES1]|uniref:ATP-dependent helicase HrpB n=1 Tax=Hyphomicrobium denitrificans 1NES1 TaxID=670307 RepID=N0BH22_9HYPH|nr:ATP-dependent helicase HrpB [Hyphomicrobium denitrificans]AGK59435.1 ATP-dependent helicase HrpB [Hyphomicrobium denitrificans 1NES1]